MRRIPTGAVFALLLAVGCGGPDATDDGNGYTDPIVYGEDPVVECARADGLEGAIRVGVLISNPDQERDVGVRIFHKPCGGQSGFLDELGPYPAPTDGKVWIEEDLEADATPVCVGEVTVSVLVRRADAPDTWVSTNTLVEARDFCQP